MFCLLLVAGATLCADSLGVQLWWAAWHGMAWLAGKMWWCLARRGEARLSEAKGGGA